MTRVVITDETEATSIIAQRRAAGLDTYDEVWDGVYRVVPAGNRRHGETQAALIAALRGVVELLPLIVSGPVNIGTSGNYRVPDAAVLDPTADADQDDVFVPTARMVVEVRSAQDDTYDKFPFYWDHGVAEIVVALPRQGVIELWIRHEASQQYTQSRRSSVLAIQPDTAGWLGAAIGWVP